MTPTVNNDGRPYIIAMDVAKEGAQVWDLTTYLKVRVNDSGFPLQIKWTNQGQLMNLEGFRPYVQGNVGQYKIDDDDHIIMDADAAAVSFTGDPKDCLDNGVAVYRFPEQMFPKEGIFKGFVGLRDEAHNRMTGIDVYFVVLADTLQMGVACDYYISDLEKAIQNAENQLHENSVQFNKELSDAQTHFATVTSNALKQLQDDYTKEVAVHQGALLQDTKGLELLGAQIKSLEVQLETQDIVKLSDFNQAKLDLNNAINGKISEIHDTPLSYKDLDAVKAAFPNGTASLIVTDDGHRAIYRDGSWKDGGIYSGIGVADNSIGPQQISGKSIDEYAPNVFSTESSNNSKGIYYDENGQKQDGGTIWNSFSLGVAPGEAITWSKQTFCYSLWKDEKFVKGGSTKNSQFPLSIVIPDGVDELRLPYQNNDEFLNNFVVVRGTQIPYSYPQNNVLDDFYVPFKNISHQATYAQINGSYDINITSDENGVYTMNLPEDADILLSNGNLFPITNKSFVLSGLGHSLGSWLYYDMLTNKMYAPSAYDPHENLVSLGVIYPNAGKYHLDVHTKLNILWNGKHLYESNDNLYSPWLTNQIQSGIFYDENGQSKDGGKIYSSYKLTVAPGQKLEWNMQEDKVSFWNDNKFVVGFDTQQMSLPISFTVPNGVTEMRIPIRNTAEFKGKFWIRKSDTNFAINNSDLNWRFSGIGNIEINTIKNTIQFNNMNLINGELESVNIDANPIDFSNRQKGVFIWLNLVTSKIEIDPSDKKNKVLVGTYLPNDYVELMGNPKLFIDGVKYNYEQPLSGKEIVTFGDSITAGVNTERSYSDDLHTVTGASVINLSLPNSCISNKPADDTIGSDTTDTFVTRYKNIDKNADIIWIFGGINDWVYDHVMGDDHSTDTTTFKGALRTMLSALRNDHPYATILMGTPMMMDWTKRPATNGNISTGENSRGLKILDYVNAVKEVCAEYAVPVLDMYHEMFYPFNDDFKSKWMTDNLHPTRLGHIKMANVIGKFINQHC